MPEGGPGLPELHDHDGLGPHAHGLHGHGHFHVPDPDYTGDVTWEQETVELVTVGVDIGSATTHVTIARVHLQRVGQVVTERYTVVKRDTLWQSPVELTPYVGSDLIDADRVREIVREAYDGAGMTPSDVDSGAVLLTGVALLRRNAETLTRELAALAGDFVCAAASHHMEAHLAAHGSGAVELSVRLHDAVLSLDIGGGTAKYAWLRAGRVVHTAAVGVGGRLVAWDADLVVTRLEPYAARLAAALGIPLELGAPFPVADRDRLCAAMADVLVEALTARPSGPGADLVLTEWPVDVSLPSTVVLSGGVAEYGSDALADPQVRDLGATLSAALRERLSWRGVRWRRAPSAIRATVLGAAGYAVEVSGNTVHVGEGAALPLRDVPVVVAHVDAADDLGAATAAVAVAIDRHQGVPNRPLCLYLDLTGRWAGYADVRRLADAVTAAWTRRRSRFAGPLALITQADLARSLGRILEHECGLSGGVVCLDGIRLSAFDFIDIGPAQKAVHPVVIKSLVFDAN